MIKSNYFQRLFIPFVYTVSTSILRDGTRIQFVQLFPSGLKKSRRKILLFAISRDLSASYVYNGLVWITYFTLSDVSQ